MPLADIVEKQAPAPKGANLAELSIQDRASPHQVQEWSDMPTTFLIGGFADDVPDWWTPARDLALDTFWRTETMLAGAIYSIAAKVSALPWTIHGPPRQVSRAQHVLTTADLGAGWTRFMLKIIQDILTQDNGAFIEVLRPPKAGPESLPVGLAHLDPQRCTRTGDIEFPVIYSSARTGKSHKLAYWQVLAMSDMTSTREEMREVGFCAVSRVLRAAQLIRDISLYMRQKVSGKRVPAILFAKGVRSAVVHQAIKEALDDQESEGLSHYTKPVIVASQDPGQDLGVQLIEFSGLPDGFDEDTHLRWYISKLALGFGVDYGEFAPLPGRSMGSATESLVQHEKAKGKGPRTFAAMFEHLLNWAGILPESCTFEFGGPDEAEEETKARVNKVRLDAVTNAVTGGVLDRVQALQLLNDWGVVPSEFLQAPDVTPEVTGSELEEPAAGLAVTGTDTEAVTKTFFVGRKASADDELRAAAERLLDDYERELQDIYDDWVVEAAERMEDTKPDDEDDEWAILLALLLSRLSTASDRYMRLAFDLGSNGLGDEDLAPADQAALAAAIASNLAFLETSLLVDIRAAGTGYAGQAAGLVGDALHALDWRIRQYVGAIWLPVWQGLRAMVRKRGDNPAVRRVLDSGAEHCASCIPKARTYESFDIMIAQAGYPGDGSDLCRTRCRCRVELVN